MGERIWGSHQDRRPPACTGRGHPSGGEGEILQKPWRSTRFGKITPRAVGDATFFVAHVVTAGGETRRDETEGLGPGREREAAGQEPARGPLTSTHEPEARGRRHSSPAFSRAHFRSASQSRSPELRPAPVPEDLGSACPLPCLTTEATRHASQRALLINKTICPPVGEVLVKVEKQGKRCAIFFFFLLEVPLEHPRVPSARTQPPARCTVGVVVRQRSRSCWAQARLGGRN